MRSGRGPAFVASVVLAASLVALGIAGYAQQRIHGDVVTGMRTIGQGGAVWGLYIVFDVVFVGLAFGGIAFTAIVRLLHLRSLRPLARIAQLLTLVSLALAGLCVLADLGRPLRGLANFPRYARTVSPFFGTFSLVACTGSLAAFVYLWLDGRADAAACAARGGRLAPLHRLWAFGWKGTPHERWRHRRSSFWLCLATLPLLVAAYSTLGFVFGIQGGRPGWYGALQAPGFLVLASLSTVATLVVVAAIARRVLRLEAQMPARLFLWLGNAMWILALVAVYVLAVEMLTASYAASEAETRVARALRSGPYAPLFWATAAGLVVPAAVLFSLFLRKRISIGWTLLAALVLNAATVLKRFLVVVPSQTHGQLLPFPDGAYAPTWVELAVVGGLLGLGVLAFIAFARVFPLVPVDLAPGEAAPPAVPEPTGRRWTRAIATGGALVVGVALAVAGFLLSARTGTEPWRDPIVPFSPVVFVTGLVLAFYSAAVYEVLPASVSPRPERRP